MTDTGSSERWAQRRTILFVAIAGWLLPSVLSAIEVIGQAPLYHRPVDWRAVLFSACYWLILCFLVPAIYAVALRFPLHRGSWRRNALVHLLGIQIVCLVWSFLGYLLAVLLHRPQADAPPVFAFVRWFLESLPGSSVTYSTIVAVVYAATLFVEKQQEQAQVSRLAAQLAEARLAALRSQLNPHFLFNSLNTVAVLVRGRQKARALEIIDLLADVLRRVLQPDARQETPLAEEVALLEHYLRIEQIRFSDRLRVTWALDRDALDLNVPTMILQPIVENAIRHGVAKRRAAGELSISAEHNSGCLEIVVCDDGEGFVDGGIKPGIGLANTLARLKDLYGDNAALIASNNPTGGARVSIRLPAHRG